MDIDLNLHCHYVQPNQFTVDYWCKNDMFHHLDIALPDNPIVYKSNEHPYTLKLIEKNTTVCYPYDSRPVFPQKTFELINVLNTRALKIEKYR